MCESSLREGDDSDKFAQLSPRNLSGGRRHRFPKIENKKKKKNCSKERLNLAGKSTLFLANSVLNEWECGSVQ